MHYFGENIIQLPAFLRHCVTGTTDLPVLAKDAGKITMAEENIADSFFSADYRFFSMMDANGTDRIGCIASADSGVTCQAVGSAIPRTDPALP